MLTDLAQDVRTFVEEWMEEHGFEQIPADTINRNWPLDNRAKVFKILTNGELMAVPSDYTKRLDYYGGFEYVCDDCKFTVGDWTFYSSEDGRVADVLDALREGIGYENC